MTTDPNTTNPNTPNQPNRDGNTGEMDALLGLGGMLGGFTQFLNQLGNLAEKGEQLKRATQNDGSTPNNKVSTSFGYTVKFGGESFGGSSTNETFSSEQHVTPRQTTTNQPASGTPSTRPVQSVREPVVDTFDEGTHFLIVAEMPGISRENIELNINGTTGLLSGSNSLTRYEKQIEIPASANPEKVSIATNNGIVEIRIAIQ